MFFLALIDTIPNVTFAVECSQLLTLPVDLNLVW